MASRAFITGVSGVGITSDERAFLREALPWGLILFRRNIENKGQVFRIIEEFRSCVGDGDAPVLVDQEGGRVQRLGPPHWPAYPPGAAYARLYARDPALGLEAARLGARLMAADLSELGITVDCLPLADLPTREADPVIGDRAYGDSPQSVAAVARAVAEGLAEGGVLPVLKHLPGHGRAQADSHERLPVVDAGRAILEKSDFAAFRPLADLPLGMTAHVVFSAIDPVRPATTSATMIGEVIRRFIGFDGALMTDDLSMGALTGPVGERTRDSLRAGCDLALHCNGDLAEMQAVAAEAPLLSGEAARRADAARAARRPAVAIDAEAARRRFALLIAEQAAP